MSSGTEAWHLTIRDHFDDGESFTLSPQEVVHLEEALRASLYEKGWTWIRLHLSNFTHGIAETNELKVARYQYVYLRELMVSKIATKDS